MIRNRGGVENDEDIEGFNPNWFREDGEIEEEPEVVVVPQ